MKKHTLLSWVLIPAFAAFCIPTGAWGQDVDTAKSKLLAKRAAEADAYRKLAETIKGLRLTSETLVKDFVVESDVIRSELDAFIKGIRLGEPTWHEDLTCEVPAEVTVQKIITQLREMHSRHYHGNRVEATDFESIRKFVKSDVVRVVGMGAPRSDLPPDLPEGVVEVITSIPTLPEPRLPELWRRMPSQARLKAKRAAGLDAQRRLLERIKGLRVTSDTMVRDFAVDWDEIQTSASGYLVGAHETGVYYHTFEPIVEVTYAVPVESVITTIREIHRTHYRGRSVTTEDITNIRKQFKRDIVEATGSGVPPAEYMQAISEVVETPIPDWTAARISATGEGTDPDMEAPQGKLRAARAAELDAKRRLMERVQGLHLDSQTRVGDFIAESDEITARLNTVVTGSMIERTTWDGGAARVTVSVPGMEVWAVLNDSMILERRRH